MYTEQEVIAFAKWWNGTEVDIVFKNYQDHVTIERAFKWWKNKYTTYSEFDSQNTLKEDSKNER